MTNLPKALRQQLAQQYLLTVPQLERKQRSKQDGTVKFLWRLHDGNTVESVLMHYSYGASLCISTQVGCRMGCTFCASTLGGLVRNLQAGEMLDQVLNRYTYRGCASPTLSSWVWASRWIIMSRWCAFCAWSATRTGCR